MPANEIRRNGQLSESQPAKKSTWQNTNQSLLAILSLGLLFGKLTFWQADFLRLTISPNNAFDSDSGCTLGREY
jgi:hypothetical protein